MFRCIGAECGLPPEDRQDDRPVNTKAPFYFIEYAIAYLGALQLWARVDDEPTTALADYKRALSLGGTRPLNELYEAAGVEFRFDRDLVGALAQRLEAAIVAARG